MKLVDLPLHDPRIVAISCSTKRCLSCLPTDVFSVVEWVREVKIWSVLRTRMIRNVEVMSSTKCRTIASIAIVSVLGPNTRVLLSVGYREQEILSLMILPICPIATPGKMRICSNNSSKLGLSQNYSVFFSITTSMESAGLVSFLRRSIEKSDLLYMNIIA